MNILSLESIKRLVFLGGCSLTTALSADIFDQSFSALNEIDNSKMRNEATVALNPLQQNQAPTLQDRVIPVSDKQLPKRPISQITML